MMKKNGTAGKGQYGYRNSHVRKLVFLTAGLIVLIALQIFLAGRSGNSLRILFTFTGIITVLPMANVASPLLAMGRYRSPARAQYEKVRGFEDRGQMLYDLVFTTKEHIFPVDFLLIRPGEVHCLYAGGAAEKAELKDHLQRYLRLEKVYSEICLYESTDAFLERLERFPADGSGPEEEQRAAGLLKNISF